MSLTRRDFIKANAVAATAAAAGIAMPAVRILLVEDSEIDARPVRGPAAAGPRYAARSWPSLAGS